MGVRRSGLRGAALAGVLAMSSAALLPATSISARATSAPSEDTVNATSSEALAFSAKPTKRVRTAYGKAPVRTTPGRRYVFTFTAKAGDRVRVRDAGDQVGSRTSRFKGPRGTVRTTGRDGFATIKRSGTYSVAFRATAKRTQLLKLKIRSTSSAFDAPKRRGVQYAVDVPVKSGAVRVTSTAALSGFQSGGRFQGAPDAVNSLTAVLGMPVKWSAAGASNQEQPVVRATTRTFLAPEKATRVVVDSLPAVRVSVDAGAVTVPKGSAGVVLDIPDTGTSEFISVVGGQGGAFTPDGRALAQGGEVVRTSGGAAKVIVLNSGSRPARSLAVVTTPVHDAVAVPGGASVRVPADAAGRDVLVKVVAPASRGKVGLDLTAAPTGAAWTVSAANAVRVAYPTGCNGCGEGDVIAQALGRGLGLNSPQGSLAIQPQGGLILLSTGGVVAQGDFELALTWAPLS